MKKYLKKRWRSLLIGKSPQILLFKILSILFAANVHAQEIVNINNTKGSCTVLNISPEKAKEEAILEAKKNALRRAGIAENINSIDALNTYADNRMINQTFNSFSFIELSGAIVDWSLVREERTLNEFDNFVYSVYIDATIIKYATAYDREFALKIEGLKEAYREGEAISFTIQPTKTCFLSLFLLESSDSVSIIYPNQFEPPMELQPAHWYTFPMNTQINYVANLNNSQESNVVIFIATKNNISFIKDLNYKNLINWINEIEPYEKYVISKIINFYSK